MLGGAKMGELAKCSGNANERHLCSAVLTLLDSVKARDSLPSYRAEVWTRELRDDAMDSVSKRDDLNSWRCFLLLTSENPSGEEVDQ